MKRPIYLRLEYRDNQGNPITRIERINVVDTGAGEAELINNISKWSAEAGKMLALSMNPENAQHAQQLSRELRKTRSTRQH